jgi:membrane associated rhomboid family serine protease
LQSQIHLPKIDRINKILVITFVSAFILEGLLKLAGFSLISFFGLSFNKLLSGHIYQLVTYPLIAHSLMEIIFDGLILWFIGTELSNLWGDKKYLTFLACAVGGGALIYISVMGVFFSTSPYAAFPLSGPAGLCSALCMAFGILFPERTMYLFIFPVQAKWFVIILVAINLYQGITSPAGVMAWSQLGAMGGAFAWMMYQTKKGQQKKKRPNPSHLSVIDGGRDKDGNIKYH